MTGHSAEESILVDFDEQLAALWRRLDEADSRPGDLTERSLGWISDADEDQIARLLHELLLRPNPAPGSAMEKSLGRLLAAWERWRDRLSKQAVAPPPTIFHAVAALYSKLGANSRARWRMLSFLAAGATREELIQFASLLAEDPPHEAAVAFAPLFQNRDWPADALFPKLLEALDHLSVAPAALDLMNFLTREGRVPSHPAAARKEQLASLLGSICGRLGQLEDRVSQGDAPSPDSARQAAEGVALAVSLCDALGLIGDESVAGKLMQALDLRHRRIRVEAAAALARLGVEEGKTALLELAAEPVARLRVLSYAEELGMADRVNEQFATPEARSEAELASWLAEPTQMGMAPHSMELLDTRELYWPGYEQPITCRLFRYAYRIGGAALENIGITGPATYALASDLTRLSLDEVYALFAGWQAEHEEIFEIDAQGANWPHSADIERLRRRLRDEGYHDIEPITLGSFFGDKTLVARAHKEGQSGWAVVDASDVAWRPQTEAPREIGAEEVYFIYKGKRLLNAFNT